ncbi:MAG: ABC transporter ATP-binding protein [Lachnospiraceae bacterium]|nr:ABC transporter ATP-binding protein [Lachnospiraceae bacterium]
MIKVTNLCKMYGDKVALDNVSFEVEAGHIYGLLGPHGAGTSTTMNIVTGYLAPTSGEVSINGHVLGKETREAKKCIGYLPEIPPLYPDMMVREYLSFVAGIKNIEKSKRIDEVEAAIVKTGLKEVSGRLIKNLSKGYKQRVGIAQAILGGPDIIILDEPTVGLDPQQIIEIRELIRSFRDSHTVILSSHILSEIAEVCDDVLMIAHGKVVACDTTEHLMSESHDNARIFEITVKGDKDQTLKVLNSLDKILYDPIFVFEKDGNCTFRFKTEREDDIRADVSFALSDERILVLSMNEEKKSLEDTYLAIMKDSDEKYEEELKRLQEEEDEEYDDEDEDSDDENDSEDSDSEKDSDKESDEKDEKEEK